MVLLLTSAFRVWRLVRVMIGIWVMYYVYGIPHKDRTARMCVCTGFFGTWCCLPSETHCFSFSVSFSHTDTQTWVSASSFPKVLVLSKPK